jgi:hypothetical protein
VTPCVSCALEASGIIHSSPYPLQILNFGFAKHRTDSSQFAGVADGVADGSITRGVRARIAVLRTQDQCSNQKTLLVGSEYPSVSI